jgi:hypothetical protein
MEHSILWLACWRGCRKDSLKCTVIKSSKLTIHRRRETLITQLIWYYCIILLLSLVAIKMNPHAVAGWSVQCLQIKCKLNDSISRHCASSVNFTWICEVSFNPIHATNSLSLKPFQISNNKQTCHHLSLMSRSDQGSGKLPELCCQEA